MEFRNYNIGTILEWRHFGDTKYNELKVLIELRTNFKCNYNYSKVFVNLTIQHNLERMRNALQQKSELMTDHAL